MTEPRFELWASDLFDRDSSPSLQRTFTSLTEGLEALWRAMLDEGLQDDGRPTFTDFVLRGPSTRVTLPRDPFRNPELALLRRRWKALPAFTATLAALHAKTLPAPLTLDTVLLETTELPPALQHAVSILARHLGLAGEPTRDGAGWSLERLRLTARWVLPAPEFQLEVDGLSVRFVADAVLVEALDDAARVLADVLFDAGVSARWA